MVPRPLISFLSVFLVLKNRRFYCLKAKPFHQDSHNNKTHKNTLNYLLDDWLHTDWLPSSMMEQEEPCAFIQLIINQYISYL